jgi:hypothetical protein
LLFVFPLAYFGAMAVPLPAAVVNKNAPFGTEGVLTLLVDPNFDDETRLAAAQEAESLELAQSWDFLAVLFSDVHREPGEKVLQIVWPETALAVGPLGMKTVFNELEKRAIDLGFQRLEMISGAGSALENVVIFATRSSETGQVRFIKLAEKKRGVPAFEREALGIKLYSEMQDTETGLGWSELLPSGSNDTDFVKDSRIQICYEALFPFFETEKVNAWIFTNHHIFSRFRIASITYDYVLRVLNTISNSESLLIANKGTAGVLQKTFELKPESTQLKGRLKVWRAQSSASSMKPGFMKN